MKKTSPYKNIGSDNAERCKYVIELWMSDEEKCLLYVDRFTYEKKSSTIVAETNKGDVLAFHGVVHFRSSITDEWVDDNEYEYEELVRKNKDKKYD